MSKKLPTYPRILAIVPSPTGFGLAVIEGLNSLVGWGAKRVRKDMNNGCMTRIQRVIAFYQPHVIVMEEGVKRTARVRALMKRIIRLAEKSGIQVTMLARTQVRAAFFADGLGSKDALAELLANRFPEELSRDLPAKRTVSANEDYRMAMFMAVALAVAFRPNRKSIDEASAAKKSLTAPLSAMGETGYRASARAYGAGEALRK